MIRSFDWRDFPRLHRYREKGLWLDNELALTQWQIRVPAGALLAYLAPATGIFTYVVQEKANENSGSGTPIIGQFTHAMGSSCAKLAFIAPETALETSSMLVLLDHLAFQCGKRGAQSLIAEVNEDSTAFEVLREAGYAIFTRQRIWLMGDLSALPEYATPWRPASQVDEIAIRSLYHAIVPALAQQSEAPAWEKPNGFVFWQNDELLGYVHLAAGPRGILAQPFIHPDLEKVPGRLITLFNHLPFRGDRPLYVTVRSYQGWLEGAMDLMDASPGNRQAVMVKRLAVTQKADLSIKLTATGLENIQPEAS